MSTIYLTMTHVSALFKPFLLRLVRDKSYLI